MDKTYRFGATNQASRGWSRKPVRRQFLQAFYEFLAVNLPVRFRNRPVNCGMRRAGRRDHVPRGGDEILQMAEFHSLTSFRCASDALLAFLPLSTIVMASRTGNIRSTLGLWDFPEALRISGRHLQSPSPWFHSPRN